jgi:hypothetical protein
MVRERESVQPAVCSGYRREQPGHHVLLPDDAVVLAQTGLAIVLAHRPARVVLELPHGVAPPRAVEIALADGEPAGALRSRPRHDFAVCAYPGYCNVPW